MLTYHTSKTDSACNLECLRDHPPVHEFVGPVKIVLMDTPTKLYKRRMWLAAWIGIAKLLMGAAFITILYFLLAMVLPVWPSVHIMLCTFGICIPISIFMTNNLHGPSSQMKPKDHKKQHIIIAIIGCVCAAAGSTLAFLRDGELQLIITVHSIAGLVAGGFTVLSIVTGPACTSSLSIPHTLFGVPAVVASSVCFCIGLYNSTKYKNWMPLVEMLYIPIFCCVIYTIVVIYRPIKKLFRPNDYQ